MRFTLPLIIEINGHQVEHDLLVRGTYRPAEKDITYFGMHGPIDPPVPAEFEIDGVYVSVKRASGIPVVIDMAPLLLTPAIWAMIEEAGIEAAGNAREQAAADAAESRRDAT